MGMISMVYAVANISSGGKEVPECVQFTMDNDGQNTTWDFSNIIPGEPDASLFDLKKLGCTLPPPRKKFISPTI